MGTLGPGRFWGLFCFGLRRLLSEHAGMPMEWPERKELALQEGEAPL